MFSILRNRLILLAIAVPLAFLVAMCFVGYFYIQSKRIDAATQTFDKTIQKVTSMPRPKEKLFLRPGRMRILLIDATTKKVDAMFFNLPSYLRPSTPEEVEAVVFLTWENRDAGLDRRGKRMTQWFTTMEIVDLKNNRTGDPTIIEGEMPDTLKRHGSKETVLRDKLLYMFGP